MTENQNCSAWIFIPILRVTLIAFFLIAFFGIYMLRHHTDTVEKENERIKRHLVENSRAQIIALAERPDYLSFLRPVRVSNSSLYGYIAIASVALPPEAELLEGADIDDFTLVCSMGEKLSSVYVETEAEEFASGKLYLAIPERLKVCGPFLASMGLTVIAAN